MPFHFPLESVLHFRQSLERQQELRLRACNQQVAKVRHLLVHLEAALRESREAQMRQLESGTFAVEMRFQLSCEAVAQLQKHRLEEELARLEKLRDQQRAIYQQARRQYETLKGLHDRQLKAYQKEVSRKEQARLDDLFLLRRQYLRD